MWKFVALAGAASLASGAAQATLVDISYTGAITQILVPAGAGGLRVGDPIAVSLRYDTHDLVDLSNAPGLAAYNAVSVPGLTAATLANAYDRLTIAFGDLIYHARDDYDFGGNHGFGGFPGSPLVVFLDGRLLGVETEGYFNESSDFDISPIAHLTEPDFAPFDLFGDYYPNPPDYEDYEFAFFGRFDLANASISPVPEPASWAFMLAGCALIGAASRRRVMRAAVLLPTIRA